MTCYINNSCIYYGLCEPECPAQAIKPSENKYIINPELCTDSGACVKVCPADCN